MTHKTTEEYDRSQLKLVRIFTYSFIGWFGSFIASSHLTTPSNMIKGGLLTIFLASLLCWLYSGYKFFKLGKEISNTPGMRETLADELSEHYKLKSCYFGMIAFVGGIILSIFAASFTNIQATIILEMLLLFVISVVLISYQRLCQS